MKPLHFIYVTLLGLALLAGCGESERGTPRQAITPPSLAPGAGTPAPLLLTPNPQSSTIYFGVFANPQGTSSPQPVLLNNFEAAVGRTFALSPHYYGFYDAFPGANEADDLAHGRVPFISWDCEPSNASIAAGNQDIAIKQTADRIAAYQYPVFIRYMWEMNLSSIYVHGNCYDPKTDLSNGFFSPQEYVAAWARIRYIFAAEGVRNAVWVWNPSGGQDASPYYPGDAYVDWVGFDLYDRQNFPVNSLFQQEYNFMLPYSVPGCNPSSGNCGKPIIIGETGATCNYQPAFFAGLAGQFPGRNGFPRIKAVVYFDAVQPSNKAVYNWTITSASNKQCPTPSITSFKQQIVQDPYFGAMPTISPVPAVKP